MNKIIELKEVTKIFKNERRTKALDKINLSIHDGEFISVVGKSGSGKSTLIKVIGLLIEEFEGEYLYEGNSISAFNENEKAKMRNLNFGYIFQDFALIEELTAKDNILLPQKLNRDKMAMRDDAKMNIQEIALKLEIDTILNDHTYTLSGGEKQRIAIARALINDPKIILADEPTGALDSKNGTIIYQILKRLNDNGKTIILITHDNQLANKANRCIEISDGKIVD